jgi:aerobic C4-dicarboxylate transport protein
MALEVSGDVAGQSPRPKGRGGRWRYLLVIIAIAAGVATGRYYPDVAVTMKPLGDLFVKLIRLVIPPVIFLSIVTGIAGMSSLTALREVAFKALAYFLVVSTLALIVGMTAANLLHPGAGMNIDPHSLHSDSIDIYISKAHDFTALGFLAALIPDSVAGAFVDGNILQVLLIAILFGIGLSMAGERARLAISLLEALAQAVFRVVDILMLLAPIGAFGAMAFTIGKFGIGGAVNLAGLVASFYLTSAMFVLVVLGIVAAMHGFSILSMLRYIKSELVVVIGTSSSESVLPSLMEKLEYAGCSRSVVGLVVPAGYSFNLDGTNIYMSLAALFIAQATNTHLTFQDQALLLGVAMLSSKGAAGVTGAGFITLAATLSVLPSVPIAGLALIFGVDRFMSECRAVTNCIGNAVATIVVSRWQNQLDRDRLREALSGKPRVIAPLSASARLEPP